METNINSLVEEGEIVYAIHNFDASVEDEISLLAGEPILVIEKDDLYNDGWWQGKNSRGEVGLFPMNFITFNNPQTGSGMLGRYANLLNEVEVSDDNQSINDEEFHNNKLFINDNEMGLDGRLSDPLIGERSEDSKILHSNFDNSDSEQEKNRQMAPSPLVPSMLGQTAPSIVVETNRVSSGDEVSVSSKNPLTRSSSTKLASKVEALKESEGHRRTLTSTAPLTPNRSSFRQSVRYSTFDTTDFDPTKPSPELWTSQQVIEWLEQAGFSSLIDNFKEYDINGELLIKLDLNTLKDIGILAFGKRFNLLNAIGALKAKYGLSSPNQNQHLELPSKHAQVDDDMPKSDSSEAHSPTLGPNSSPFNSINQVLSSNELPKLKEPTSELGHKSNNSHDSHSHVAQWLQQSADCNFEHDLLKESGIPPIVDELGNESSGRSSKTHSRDNSYGSNKYINGSNNLPPVLERLSGHSREKSDGSYKFPPPPKSPPTSSSTKSPNQNTNTLKKQVSFSQARPEVIGVSVLEDEEEEDSPVSPRAAQGRTPFAANGNGDGAKRTVPPPKSSGQAPQIDRLPNGENAPTRTYNLEAASPAPETNIAPVVTVESFLKKQEGAIKLWKSRYCKLTGTTLSIYDSDKLKKLKLQIDLRGFKPVLDPNLNPGKYCFKLVHPLSKPHHFSSDDANIIKQWMKALMKVSIDRDINAPVVTSCTVNTVPLHVARKLAPRPPSAVFNANKEETNGSTYI